MPHASRIRAAKKNQKKTGSDPARSPTVPTSHQNGEAKPARVATIASPRQSCPSAIDETMGKWNSLLEAPK